MIDKKDRIIGALIGTAYGDAMGMPSEGWSKRRIRIQLGEIRGFMPGPLDNIISKGLSPGEVTDDTMNTIFVARMLCENKGRVNSLDFINKIRKWAAESEKSTAVIGPSTAKAFDLLDRGIPMEETGRDGITNGAAMKILPLGLIREKESLDELLKEVHNLCMPTHNTSLAISGAGAVAAAAAAAVNGEKNLEEILDFAKQGADLGRSFGYDVSGPSVSKRIALGQHLVDRGGDTGRILDDIYDLIGTGLSSGESVPAALALVYLSKGEPAACARFCANIGGDTDTLGAMACGICGAMRGTGAFRKEDIRLLEEVNGLNFTQIGEQLSALCCSI